MLTTWAWPCIPRSWASATCVHVLLIGRMCAGFTVTPAITRTQSVPYPCLRASLPRLPDMPLSSRTAENPFYFAEQQVDATLPRLDLGQGEQERVYGHGSLSEAYHKAVAREHYARVGVDYKFKTYHFRIFMDAVSEPGGAKFMIAKVHDSHTNMHVLMHHAHASCTCMCRHCRNPLSQSACGHIGVPINTHCACRLSLRVCS